MSENEGGDLTFERVFASPDLNGPTPRQAKLSPDGRYLTLLRNRDDDRQRYDLWGYDRETKQWSMLVDSEQLGSGRELSEDEKMQRERARVGNLKGIITYQWARTRHSAPPANTSPSFAIGSCGLAKPAALRTQSPPRTTARRSAGERRSSWRRKKWRASPAIGGVPMIAESWSSALTRSALAL